MKKLKKSLNQNMNHNLSVVYLLTHSYEVDEIERMKFLGVFESKKEAERAISKFLLLPGFKDYPDCFEISEFEVNEILWDEGFVDPFK